MDIIQEKVFNIFLLPNKKEWIHKIFKREGFDEYLNMCAVFILKYLDIRKIKNNFYFWSTRFSFYKNILYKNIEDEMGQKVKNILRICSSWTFAYKVKNTLS